MLPKINIGTKLKIADSLFNTIGIDHYRLNNLFNNIETWQSYTMISNNERINLSNTDNQIILWRLAEPQLPKGYELNWNFTGLSEIKFEGDKGISEPLAELLWFEKGESIFVLERFIEAAKPHEAGINIKTYAFAGKLFRDFELA